VRAATVGECIHPRRARPFAHSLRLIWWGYLRDSPALESRFNERIDSRLVPCELVGVPPSVYRSQKPRAMAGIPPCVVKQVTRSIRNREAPVPIRA
jgi:hypothetical protein